MIERAKELANIKRCAFVLSAMMPDSRDQYSLIDKEVFLMLGGTEDEWEKMIEEERG